MLGQVQAVVDLVWVEPLAFQALKAQFPGAVLHPMTSMGAHAPHLVRWVLSITLARCWRVWLTAISFMCEWC